MPAGGFVLSARHRTADVAAARLCRAAHPCYDPTIFDVFEWEEPLRFYVIIIAGAVIATAAGQVFGAVTGHKTPTHSEQSQVADS